MHRKWSLTPTVCMSFTVSTHFIFIPSLFPVMNVCLLTWLIQFILHFLTDPFTVWFPPVRPNSPDWCVNTKQVISSLYCVRLYSWGSGALFTETLWLVLCGKHVENVVINSFKCDFVNFDLQLGEINDLLFHKYYLRSFLLSQFSVKSSMRKHTLSSTLSQWRWAVCRANMYKHSMTIQLWFHVYLTIKTTTVDIVARKIDNFLISS